MRRRMHDSWEVQGLDLPVVGSDVRLIWKSEIDVLEVLESLAHETELSLLCNWR